MNDIEKVDMKISTKGRYTLRILADIAEYGVKNVPIREIAGQSQGFFDKYLEDCISLSSAGPR